MDADAPSGLGFNAAMAQIDALIAARVAAPSGMAAGEVPVWNGTTWVRSSATRINNGGNALPKITVGALSSGPPASPSDGDIWVATGIDSHGVRWQFQYDAGSSSSFKWAFIGGGALTNFSVSATQTTTLVRAGDYEVDWAVDGTASGNFYQDVLGVSSGTTSGNAAGQMTDGGTGIRDTLSGFFKIDSILAGGTVSHGISGTSVIGAVSTWIRPLRVA